MRRFLLFIISIIVISQFVLIASASVIGLEATPVSEEDLQKYIDNSNIQISSAPSMDRSISCFDVSENGLIAVGLPGTPDTIHIYDSKGIFQYRYIFECDGIWGIGFVDDCIAIYYVRGDLIKLIDTNGQIIAVYDVPLTSANHAQIYNLIDRTSKQINDKTYHLESSIAIFEAPYSRIIEISADGTTRVIYDVTFAHTFRTVIGVILIISFFAFFIRGLIQKEKEKGQAETSSTP